MPDNSDLESQEFTLNRGELISLPFTTLTAQYPNASAFNWQFQVVEDDGTVLLTKTGSATVSSLSFTVSLTVVNTTALTVGLHAFTLWDTTNTRIIAKGTINVGPAQS